MTTHPRYRDRHGRLWEDRDGPVLITHDPDEYPDWITMLAIQHAYGPLVPVDTTEEAPADATDRDKVLRIVADHIHRDTTYGGLDWDDLVEDLRRAGYTLPDPTEHPKEN